MTNKHWLIILVSCVSAFMVSLGLFLSGHHEWATVTGPEGIGHLLVMFGTFLGTLVSALKYQMNDKQDKISERKLNDLNREE